MNPPCTALASVSLSVAVKASPLRALRGLAAVTVRSVRPATRWLHNHRNQADR